MIVDDRHVIIGSANINDRSMNGSRDSELAVYIKDTLKVDILLDSQPFKAYEFAHKLRMNLFQEHFGLPYQQVLDPLDDSFF